LITSSHNLRLQRVRALLSRRQEREREGAFVIEGVRLVEEACQSQWFPQQVFFSERLSERGRIVLDQLAAQGSIVDEVSPQVMDSIAGTETPQGILAVLPFRILLPPPDLDFILIIDNLRDPGNLGTILRTAAAAGVQAVLMTPGTTDPFAPKVLRSAMGAHFRLPFEQCDWGRIENICKPGGQEKIKILLAESGQGTPCWQLNLRQPVAIITGGEAEGASPQARQLASEMMTIPMPGKSESLNAAAATAVLLFEVVRQRSQ
jgi:RNA methyltransferase, TrmH family